MVLTRHVDVVVRPEQKIQHLCIHPDSSHLAWVEGQKTILLAEIDSKGQTNTTCSIEHPHLITVLLFWGDVLIAGDEMDGISCYNLLGEFSILHEIDGGVLHCMVGSNDLVVISGLGLAYRISVQGELGNFSSTLILEDCLHMVAHRNRVYFSTQGGEVSAFEGHLQTWSRPKRGTLGERITAIGTTTGGGFFLSREGHGLVAGEEEAIEFEYWVNDVLVKREDHNRRLLTSCPSANGAILGFDDGSVMELSEDGTLETILKTGHPVRACCAYQDHIFASSWFYIHGSNKAEQWKIEHQGMPSHLVVNHRHGHVYVAGHDQNDYTEPEPLGMFSFSTPLMKCDEGELGLWFEVVKSSANSAVESLYEDTTDLLNYLTDEEKLAMSTGSPPLVFEEDLISAMQDSAGNEGTPSSKEENSELDQLFHDLEGVTEMAFEDSQDLLETLQSGEIFLHRPQAQAGEDQQVLAGQDNTAVVHLDGRGTQDPHHMITRWSWHNNRGEELASHSQLKLRLPVGKHEFELRITDRDGSWTTDTVVIEVLPSSTS